jgi:hypothetical protein
MTDEHTETPKNPTGGTTRPTTPAVPGDGDNDGKANEDGASGKRLGVDNRTPPALR